MEGALDVCVYAIMSNYCHLVVHANQWRASHGKEVAERWCKLFSEPLD